MTEAAPAGWYPDPARVHDHRYWDGQRWTDGVATKGVVSEAPLPAEGAEEAWAELEDQRARWSGWIALIAVGAAVLSFIAQGLLYFVGDLLGGEMLAILLAQVGLYGGFFLTCWLVCRNRGSGDMRRDFGLRYRRGDWWRGLAISVLARIAAVVASVVLVLLFSEELTGNNTEAFEDETSVVLLLTLAFAALVLAPFFEEIFFRGLIQRSLESVLPIGGALALQALLFGLFHLGGAEGLANVGVILATGAAGTVFGVVAWRYHRLGPGIAAHAFFNVLPIAILFVDR